MDSQTIIIVVALTLVGLGCGVAIFLANRFLPEEDKLLKRTEEISKYFPGMNCGACGVPGCFAYSQELAKDADYLEKAPCMRIMNDEDRLRSLTNYLEIEISPGTGRKVISVQCSGNSETLYDYAGVNTCKAAAQLSGGYKKCPYACLGFGDCVAVCHIGALTIDKEKNIAVVNWDICAGCGICALECPQNLINIIPKEMPQYMACNYQSKKNIPGRERCSIGCMHCRLCVKVSKDGEVGWDEVKGLPVFDEKNCTPAPAAIEKCPKKVIRKRETKMWDDTGGK